MVATFSWRVGSRSRSFKVRLHTVLTMELKLFAISGIGVIILPQILIAPKVFTSAIFRLQVIGRENVYLVLRGDAL